VFVLPAKTKDKCHTK